MKIRAYKIEFMCAKCGSIAAVSGEKLYRDLDLVVDKTLDARMCHVCGDPSITFSHLHAELAEEEDIPKKRYELAYKCETCGMTFRSDYWVKQGDTTPFKNPEDAGITCVNRSCKGSKLYLRSCKQINR